MSEPNQSSDAARKNNESRSSQRRDLSEKEAEDKANNPGQEPYAWRVNVGGYSAPYAGLSMTGRKETL